MNNKSNNAVEVTPLCFGLHLDRSAEFDKMSFSTHTNRRRRSQETPEYVKPINHRRCLRLLPAALGLLFASCTHPSELSGPQAAIDRSFEAPKGKALICVYRPSKPFTGFIRRPVFINKQHIASTGSGSFVAVPVQPGTYTVQAAGSALIDSPEYRRAYPDITLKMSAGQTIFIRQINVPSSANHLSSVMMLQTGGAPVPLLIKGGLPPYGAAIVDRETARAECSTLKQLTYEPLEGSVSQ